MAAGKKNRKHKRNAVRSQSMARYRAEMRWQRNKARRVDAEKARQRYCQRVREAAINNGEDVPNDISRRVRALKRAA